MSNEFGLREAKPCGSRIWKKSNGRAFDGSRVALTVVRIAASCAAPAGVEASGCPLNAAQALYSAVVIAAPLVPVPNGSVSVVISVGKVPKPGGVLPVLTYRKLGWLKALIRSTRN